MTGTGPQTVAHPVADIDLQSAARIRPRPVAFFHPARLLSGFGLLGLAVPLLALAGCAGSEPGATTEPASPAARSAPALTPTPLKDQAGATTDSPSDARWIVHDCREDDAAVYTDLAQVWVSEPGATDCDVEYTGERPFTPTDPEAAVLDAVQDRWNEVRGEDAADREDAQDIYEDVLATCANSGEEDVDLLEAEGALMVCPQAPHAALLEKYAQGALLSDGAYVVGRDIPAGTYRTGTGVADCAWERRAASGRTVARGHAASDDGGVTLEKGEIFVSDECEPWTRVE